MPQDAIMRKETAFTNVQIRIIDILVK